MEFDQFDRFTDDGLDDSINLRDVLGKYLIHWYWFILSAVLFFVLSYFYLKSEAPKYQASGTVLIKEKKGSSSINDFSTFEDLGLTGSSDNSLVNEILILSSRRLMKEVVKELKLNMLFFIENSPYDLEQYPVLPIFIGKIDDKDSLGFGNQSYKTDYDFWASFSVLILSNEKFEFFNSEGETVGIKKFGQIFKTSYGPLSISLNKSFTEKLNGKTINVFFRPLDVAVSSFISKITIEQIDERSRVLKLTINESVKEKAIAIINNLIQQYNIDAVNDKNQIFLETTEFLDDRLKLLTTELIAIETTAERFKEKNKIVEGNMGELFLQSSSENENQLISSNIQKELINFMLNELKNNGVSDLLPANIGLTDASILTLAGTYNELVLRRNRVLKSSSELNPIIVDVDSQLAVLKNNLKISLINLRSSIEIQINELSKQSRTISSRISSVPKNEREFKNIVRQQETKNVLYLFLLQKREESILSSSVNIDKAKIIDTAFSNGSPVSPKKKIFYMASILVGLLIPFLIIYVFDLLDTKIHDEKDLKRLKIPYLGDVPKITSKQNRFISDGDNSTLAEAFRYIRTNIDFMLDSKDKGKTVFVTSTLAKEGKTVSSINLAISLAISGKKTLLLALDLRAPKTVKYLKSKKMLGVSNFIKDNSLTIDDITDRHTKFENLDIINSGDIPPNPVELLMSKRLNEIFVWVKEDYEYIIVDTPPVGMVTDTIQISKYADLTIYVIKAGFLDKRMLNIPERLYKEKRLTNMSILINGLDTSKGNYNYGYSYGYGNEKKKPWYKKGKSKVKNT